jgi:hypothetical protein
MKPTPQQLIDGVRSRLREVIAPELVSDHARAEIRRVMAVLRDVDWNDAAFITMRENVALEGILADVNAWIEADAARAQALGLTSTPGSIAADSPRSFAECDARNRACRAALAGMIRALSMARSDTKPSWQPELSRLRADIARRLAELHARPR